MFFKSFVLEDLLESLRGGYVGACLRGYAWGTLWLRGANRFLEGAFSFLGAWGTFEGLLKNEPSSLLRACLALK